MTGGTTLAGGASRLALPLLTSVLAVVAMLAVWQPRVEAIHDATIELSDYTAGATDVTVTATFTTDVDIDDPGGDLAVQMAFDGFDLPDSGPGPVPGWSVTVNGADSASAACFREVDGTVAVILTQAALAAGSNVEMIVSGFTNPATPGGRLIIVSTQTREDEPCSPGTNVEEQSVLVTIEPEPPLEITHADVVLSDSTAGAENVTATITLEVAGWNLSGTEVATDTLFPPDFDVTGVGQTDFGLLVNGAVTEPLHTQLHVRHGHTHLEFDWEMEHPTREFTAAITMSGITNPSTAGDYAWELAVWTLGLGGDLTEATVVVTITEPGAPAPTPPSSLELPEGTAALEDDAPCALAPQPAGAGVHLAVLDGGCALNELLEAAPGAASFWVTANGRYVGYVAGAAEFANAEWTALFPDSAIPAGTVVLVVVQALA